MIEWDVNFGLFEFKVKVFIYYFIVFLGSGFFNFYFKIELWKLRLCLYFICLNLLVKLKD